MARRSKCSGKAAHTITTNLRARRLSCKTAPTGLLVETWAIHPVADPGASVAQVQIFRDHERWHAWTGNLIRRSQKTMARALARQKNRER